MLAITTPRLNYPAVPGCQADHRIMIVRSPCTTQASRYPVSQKPRTMISLATDLKCRAAGLHNQGGHIG
eukprot:10500280-Alexandrium_andersonii.AAC.1